MTAQEIIEGLRTSQEPSRELDAQIAEFVGFKKVEQGSKVIWLAPWGTEPTKIPYYSRSIDQALQLAQERFPSDMCAFSWEPNNASAKLGKNEFVTAANPALAICLAVFTAATLSQNVTNLR